jgi:hypothetical protein
MMTTWGAWSSNDRLRAGWDLSYSPTTIGTGTSAVTVSYTLSGQTRYASYESGTGVTDFAISGSYSRSGSMNGWNEGDMGTWTVASGSFSVNTSYTGSVVVTLTGNYTSGGAYPGTKPTVTASITIPKRPYSLPAAPSGISRTRVSDTSHTIAWTRNATTGAPYDNLYLERQVDGGSWTARATLAGTATSYSDTTTSANHTYAWRIRAKNTAGYSGYNTSTSIKTTPSAPSTPTAAKDAAGNIVVSWGSLSAVAENVEIWHYANGVLDGAALATVGRVTSYTHTAPNTTQTHKYKIRTKIASPAVTSAFTADSNTVALQTAPAAPTALAPSSVAVDATTATPLTWQHNPLDTTPQRKYEFQYRFNGGAWTSSGIITSSSSTGTLAANAVANGGTLEWQVRTWGAATTGGADTTGASPWSATATVTTSSPPSVVINVPDSSGTWSASVLPPSWGYSDPEGSPQSSWTAKLYAADSITVLETRSGTTESGTTFKTKVLDGVTYWVGIRVQDSTGMWSYETLQQFTVTYAKPPVPTMELTWLPEDGAVAVQIVNPDPVLPQVATTSNDLWRSVDGSDWKLVASGLPVNASVTDFIPGLEVVNTYRVTANSDMPSSQDSAPADILCDGAAHAFVNAGPGFSQSIRVHSNVEIGISAGRARRERRSAGREYPVSHDGKQRTKTIDVSALIWNPRVQPQRASTASSWAEIEDFADLPSPACYRDPEGQRVFVTMGDVKISNIVAAARTASWTLSRSDYDEPGETDQ